ncbi:MAG TPA: patatin-like phospholipase family protein [Candidatus Saccharimonadales bacterium]|nr:patatin-like phospholipase family protein [Candidatus Saccharimonadales bacterium]
MSEITSSTENTCDIVLEGGGVKGIALVGAVGALAAKGCEFRRVAGTSAGAIVGALTAAGFTPDEMKAMVEELDYRKFQDEGLLARFGLPGKLASLALYRGIYKGNYARDWLAQQLETKGVRTFGDLRLTDGWAADIPESERYKLVVVTSDITRTEMFRFPFDYPKLGLDPDEQNVADAVHASMAMPFHFRPVTFAGDQFVDGGMLSNYPIDIFGPLKDKPWNTIGIKLSAKEKATGLRMPTDNLVEYILALVETSIRGHDQLHIDDPETQAHTVFVDTGDIQATDFNLSREQQTRLYKLGYAAATKFALP